VAAGVLEHLAGILTRKTKKLKMGDPLDETTDVGPLINEQAARQVEGVINDAVRSGAKIWIGGKRDKTFVEPTVLTDVSPEAKLFREETFGPVVPLVAFETVDDAVKMANDSPYGLQAAVFTNDISRALDVAHKLEVGGVIINWSSAVRVESLPFGGIKLSGHGREGLHDTLNEMTEQKTILIHNALS
jgi:lactaldehyde dehydrogenase